MSEFACDLSTGHKRTMYGKLAVWFLAAVQVQFRYNGHQQHVSIYGETLTGDIEVKTQILVS